MALSRFEGRCPLTKTYQKFSMTGISLRRPPTPITRGISFYFKESTHKFLELKKYNCFLKSNQKVKIQNITIQQSVFLD